MLKNPKAIMFVGNVGSGKSNLAKELSLISGKFVVVSRDQIVTMIAGGVYQRYDIKKQPIYLEAEIAMMRSSILEGFIPMIDRTNETIKSRGKYLSVINPLAAVICFDFGPGDEEGMRRRMATNRGRNPLEWIDVHKGLAKGYERPELIEGFSHIVRVDDGKPVSVGDHLHLLTIDE